MLAITHSMREQYRSWTHLSWSGHLLLRRCPGLLQKRARTLKKARVSLAGGHILGYTLPAEAALLLRLTRGVGVCAYCPVRRLGLSAELVYAYASLKSRMAASPGGWSSTRVSQEKGARDLSSLQPLTMVCSKCWTFLVPGIWPRGVIQ